MSKIKQFILRICMVNNNLPLTIYIKDDLIKVLEFYMWNNYNISELNNIGIPHIDITFTHKKIFNFFYKKRIDRCIKMIEKIKPAIFTFNYTY